VQGTPLNLGTHPTKSQANSEPAMPSPGSTGTLESSRAAALRQCHSARVFPTGTKTIAYQMLTAISFKGSWLSVHAIACWAARKPSRLEPGMSQIGLADRHLPRRPVGAKSYVFSVTPKREAARAINGIAQAEWLSPCKPTALEYPATTIMLVRLISRTSHATERYTSNRSPQVSTLGTQM
jgi:hypothetical protein